MEISEQNVGRRFEGTRIALDTVGCKLNQAEIELIAKQLTEVGYRLVPAVDEADVYIVNTCTVTHIADSKCRRLFRTAHRRNPGARLVAIGCYAERATQELARIGGVDLVLSNEVKTNLVSLLEESGFLNPPIGLSGQPICRDTGWRTRAFIKIQDGCRSSCAYCVVPLVRRREESLPVDRIIAEVNQRVTGGYREVVLTGTKVGSYHQDGTTLKGLIVRILAETGVDRLRLSSLQPQEISHDLISLWQDRRLCRHFHLSLQSGSDSMLGRMRRRYSIEDYRSAVSLIRELVTEAAITTDIIVGFPGETEAEFNDSGEFCRQMGFARVHVFPYSPRPGTEAARLPRHISTNIKKARSQKMLALARESMHSFNHRFLGRTLTVLWEDQSGGIWSGLTDNYIKVYTKSNDDLTNRLLPVKLVEAYDDGVWGEATIYSLAKQAGKEYNTSQL